MEAKKQAVGAGGRRATADSRFSLFICTVNFTVKRLVGASRRRHVMSCGALAPRLEASNLSSENHLPTNA